VVSSFNSLAFCISLAVMQIGFEIKLSLPVTATVLDLTVSSWLLSFKVSNTVRVGLKVKDVSFMKKEL